MRFELLILIRLATVESQRPSDLNEILKPLVAIDDFKRARDEGIRTLVAGGWITTKPLRVTETGRARAAEVLGVDVIPTWREIRNRYLPARALGIAPVAPRELRAAVVAQLLAKHLGLTPRSSDPQQIINLAVSTALKVPRVRADVLQAALVRRWVAGENAIAAPPVTPEPVAMRPTLLKVWSDDDVIAAVRQATARVPPAGRLGGDRVFVSAIWRQLEEGAEFPGLTFDGLKKRLVAASRRQQLTLARADLGTNVSPAEVAASEIRVLNATFHFVIDQSRH